MHNDTKLVYCPIEGPESVQMSINDIEAQVEGRKYSGGFRDVPSEIWEKVDDYIDEDKLTNMI